MVVVGPHSVKMAVPLEPGIQQADGSGDETHWVLQTQGPVLRCLTPVFHTATNTLWVVIWGGAHPMGWQGTGVRRAHQ